MNQTTPLTVKFGQVVATARQHVALWGAPAAAFLVLGMGYCLMRQPVWRVTQALVVREEAGGGLNRQGRFDNVDAMKTVLETVQEVARSRAVVAAALGEVGPEGGDPSLSWPSAADIARAQGAILVKAPKGAEFGKTEVIHLTTTASTRERALHLNRAVCLHLRARYQELRQAKALSIIEELEQAVKLAEAEQAAATQRIETMESNVGVDLGELRTLNELGAGESNLRATTTQIKNELRQARTNHDANQQLLEQLLAAKDKPEGVAAFSNRLLDSQPALRRLKDGLIDAQLRKAEVLGKMSPEHPLARAAVANEEAVRQDLRMELGTSVESMRAELEVNAALIASLVRQLAEVDERLGKLSAMRARYSNTAEDVRHRGLILEKACTELADARATVAAAQSASLITLLDTPEVGERPVGPGAKTILAACGMAGLAAGFGLLFLIHPLGSTRGRRWSDIAAMSRRATDFLRNRRGGDRGKQAASAGVGRRGGDPTPGMPPASSEQPARRQEDDRPRQDSVDRRTGDRRGA